MPPPLNPPTKRIRPTFWPLTLVSRPLTLLEHTMAIDFKLPEVSEGVESADIAEILVSEGDVIEAGQIVMEVETEKAVVELPCPHAGKITKIHVAEGDSVDVGGMLLSIEVGRGRREKRTAAKISRRRREKRKETRATQIRRQVIGRKIRRPTGPHERRGRARQVGPRRCHRSHGSLGLAGRFGRPARAGGSFDQAVGAGTQREFESRPRQRSGRADHAG